MTDATKDTIYVEPDDEITEVIAKVSQSSSKIIALVLPKHSTALQSVVNLKLLKRSVKKAKKNLVLVTNDNGLLPLAGAVGLHVAKTPTSKPYIPESPYKSGISQESSDTIAHIGVANQPLEVNEPSSDSDYVSETSASDDTDEPVVVESASKTASDSDTIQPDKTKSNSSKKSKYSKSSKKFKIPNFNKFRLRLFLAFSLLLAIIIGWVFAFIILPRAEVVIKTDTSNIELDLNVTADTGITKINTDTLSLPAVKKELVKSETETATATGEKDEGTRSKGNVTLSIACADVSGTPPTIPSGTGVSSGGKTFITQTSVSLTTPSFSGGCSFVGDTVIVAQENGDQYNLASGNYAVAGFSSVTGFGTATTGGTSKKVKIVTQSDIDTAKQKVLDKIKTSSRSELESQFNDGVFLLKDSFTESEPVITSNPAVNSQADSVTVVVKLTYSELGVSKDDISTLLDTETKRKIDTSQQMVQDNGMNTIKTRITSSQAAEGKIKFQVTTIAVAGPNLDTDSIKKQIAGKSKTETNSLLRSRQGIRDVEIHLSPFWVSSIPKSTNKIDMRFEKTQ